MPQAAPVASRVAVSTTSIGATLGCYLRVPVSNHETRYYEPIRGMTARGPTFCNILDPEARERHQPFSCPDKTLTAFCQLGALRLNVRRCLLFFFDVDNAYVLAEATRSLSLEHDSSHDEGDQLWLGHSTIPRGVACCETTVNLPALANSPSKTSKTGLNSLFVISDLTENRQTQDMPYVTSFPHGRFYAGVPITSPAGINIGAYCILDDDPRGGISERDAAFMTDMSRTIMTHLETLRAQSDRQRGTNMVTGLGAFIQASSDAKHRERRRAKRQSRTGSKVTLKESDLPVQRAIQCSVPDALAGSKDFIGDSAAGSFAHSEYFDMMTKTHKPSGQLRISPDQSLGANTAAIPSQFPIESEPLSPSATIGTERQAVAGSDSNLVDDPGSTKIQSLSGSSSSPHSGSSGSDNSSLTPRASNAVHESETRSDHTRRGSKVIASVYQQASEIMCASLSMDGVAFLDASVGTFGGLTEDVENADDTETTWTCSESEWDVDSSDADSPSSVQTTTTPCNVLGCAMSLPNGKTTDLEAKPAKKLTETFLRALLRRYPRGMIWTFDRVGDTFEDELSSDDEELIQEHMARQHQLRRRQRLLDGQMLQAMFPGASTVALHGIRDGYGRRFTVGCLLWSFDPLRILSKTSEMNFVAAFCNVAVAEDKSHEVQRSDRAKSDFLSSISHELRTPLCGILGSTEVLKDHELDSMATALVEQVDACGRTLLDIIDSLLDFANLKGRRLTQGSVSSGSINRMLASKRGSMQGDFAGMDSCIALDDLTEEAMESSVFSYFCSKSAEERSRISVVMDIDRSTGIDWSCTLASGGWRRICMNLVNNALKYTDSGYVRISMHQKRRTRQHFEAILTITDSGKGMSQAFVNEDLFRDFTQEDTNADGVGLGMNVVGQVVNAMGGSIEVTSDQHGAGTCVVVKVPLERSHNSESRDTSEGSAGLHCGHVPEGLDVGIISNSQEKRLFMTERQEQLEITAGTLAISSIEKTCKHLGLEARTGEWADCTTTKLNFMLEEDFSKQVDLMQNDYDASSKCVIDSIPSVVICKNSPSAQTIKEAWRNHPHHPGIVTEYIASPCGIRTISRAISSALQRHKIYQESEAAQMRDNATKQFAVASTHGVGDRSPSHADSPDAKKASTTQSLATPSPVDSEDHEIQPCPLPSSEQRLELRASQNQTPSIAKQQETLNSAQDTPSNGVPVLLLVDDNNINLQLLVTWAKKRKYPYLSAVDGQLALDAYIQAHENSALPTTSAEKTLARPSIVLMDINMPIMDGYESTQRIRAYEKKHHLTPSKIVALTALSSEAAHKEAFGSGCDLFLTKPVKFKALTEIIQGGQQSVAQTQSKRTS